MPDSKTYFPGMNLLSTAKNLPNRIVFWWLKDLLWNNKKLNIGKFNFRNTLLTEQTIKFADKLERAWNEELKNAKGKKRKPSLWKTIVKVYGWHLFGYSIFFLSFYSIQTLQPFLLNRMISYFYSSSTMSTQNAFFLASTIVFFSYLEVIVKRQGFFQSNKIGLQIRADCSTLMYRKLLRLSSTSKATESLINLMSNDVVKFEYLCFSLPNIFTVPIQLLAITYFIFGYVGHNAAVITIFLLILLSFPGQAIFYKVMSKLRAKQTARTDKRIYLINEVIDGIQTIKMYVWERYFEDLISRARKLEINVFFQMSYATSLVASPMNFTHQTCIVFVVLTCLTQNMPLTVAQIIPVMQLIWTAKENINYDFFSAIKAITDTNVSVKRIEKFLLNEEVEATFLKSSNSNVDGAIRLKTVTASWDSKNPSPILKNINIQIESGTLCAVVGPVGSGKSALLKLLLGELGSVTGDVIINGKICYASQKPWLFGGTIRENILFGEEYDEEKYTSVVEACALSYDLHQFPDGDKTTVSERGASLSGGQCSRINLARAVYRDADIYLLDDPLSAVDGRVAEILFEKCIETFLKDKTRIFVTNNTHFLGRMDKVIVLKNGCIDSHDPFIVLQSSNQQSNTFENYMENYGNEDNDESIKTEPLNMPSKESIDGVDETTEFIFKDIETIPKALYWRYFQSSQSYCGIFLWILNCILVVSLLAGFDYWIITWIQQQKFNQNDTTSYSSHSGSNLEIKKLLFFNNFVQISTIFIGGTILTSILKNISLYNVALNSSKNLHKKMFSCLMRTPLRFFIVNPSGQILNRFSQDTGSVDDLLTAAVFDTSDCIVIAIACLIPIVIVTWYHLISIIAISCIYYQLYKLFVPTIRKIKRLEGIAKSPVLSFVTSSFAGALTIRSCHAEELVTKEFHTRQDRHTATRFYIIALSQAFSLWLDLTTSTLLAIVIYSCLVLKSSNVSAGYVGLTMLQVFNISTNMSFTVKQFSEILAYMVNVERMVQYTELDQEKNNAIVALPTNWPSSGKLRFKRLYLRYSDDSDPVLKDLNFTVEPGTKVGIVGRTGAGKSSLISALFRLAYIDGTLYIDDIDSKKIELKTLRSKISVIPQEPIMFDGSLRSNIDPFKEFDDATLWSALEDVELRQNFDSLDYPIQQGGINLSSGQKQLLSLARAIIRNNKILILDEATANVDSATDALIQKTVRTKFADCTVLTIAHRLLTIMDSDKVLVMDNGQVVEYDHPHLLLQNACGRFTKMVKRIGADHAQHLMEIAKNVYLAVGEK